MLTWIISAGGRYFTIKTTIPCFAFANIAAGSVSASPSRLTRVSVAFVDVNLALTSGKAVWTTTEEVAVRRVAELVHGTRSSIFTWVQVTAALFDLWPCTVLPLPPLVTDLVPRPLVTAVVTFAIYGGDTEDRTLVPVVVRLAL